jgi:UDP-N-acetylglucosamine--N-acetylmuramyl-(pentapeptide) pyrophosphoryl-undecaprenol N-acetylglucosamine transferase
VLVIGGSQGSAAINAAIRSALPDIRKSYHAAHICGQGGVECSLSTTPGYAQFEYVKDELPHLFALADLVVSRAGATTLFELLALRKPHVLIPLPLKASRGDQILNARSFEKQGFSLVLPEEQLTPETLLNSIQQASTQQEQFKAAMQATQVLNSVEQILTILAHY